MDYVTLTNARQYAVYGVCHSGEYERKHLSYFI